MSFKAIRYHEGKGKSLLMTPNATLTKGSHCKKTSGKLAAGASGDDEAEYIALETKTAHASTATYCLVLPIDDTIEFEALCATTPVQATHVGNDYDFGAAASLDLTATTDKVFHIDEIKNATDKTVIGKFNKPALA